MTFAGIYLFVFLPLLLLSSFILTQDDEGEFAVFLFLFFSFLVFA